MEHFSGMHNWYACSHARPTFCNVCREALPGVTSHGLSCEGQCWVLLGGGQGSLSRLGQSRSGAGCCPLHRCRGVWDQGWEYCGDLPCSSLLAVCKFKAHKRCAVRATNNCKWTTLASIGIEIIEDEDGVSRGLPVRHPDMTDPPAELVLLCPNQEAGRNCSCPLHCVASGLGSAGAWLGDTSSGTLYQDPFLLSRWGHLHRFSGDMSALPHMLMASRGQTDRDEKTWEGSQTCFPLLHGTTSMVLGERGGL